MSDQDPLPDNRPPADVGPGAEPAEPALAAVIRAGGLLRNSCPAYLRRGFAVDCRNRTPAGWWAGCRRGELMATLLPTGVPGSDARSRCVLTACRIARLSLD